MKKLCVILLLCGLIHSCQSSTCNLNDFNTIAYRPTYAKGFEIRSAEGKTSTLIRVKNPWQGASDVQIDLFIARNNEPVPEGFQGQVLPGDAQRIICMSSSHVALLDVMGQTHRVVGVSGLQFITNPYLNGHKDQISDVGYDSNINYELLVALDPDIVLLYGVNGSASIQNKLAELRIPYAYVGEYLEEDPLGKAEWMIAVAEIIGLRESAVAIYEQLPVRYQALKQMAATAQSARPKVMVNTPYADSWFMPSQNSYLARLISDAAGKYIYQGNTSNQSLPIDLEEATLLTAQADVWIHVERAKTLYELQQLYPKFNDLACVRAGAIYNCDKRQTPGGGNDFWESGVVHPDLILQDLIKIFHPELLTDQEFTYYRKLE